MLPPLLKDIVGTAEFPLPKNGSAPGGFGSEQVPPPTLGKSHVWEERRLAIPKLAQNRKCNATWIILGPVGFVGELAPATDEIVPNVESVMFVSGLAKFV